MKKQMSKFFGFIIAVACLASPFSLMAATTIRDVVGTYQISAFSNSFPAAPLGLESQAAVGQIILNNDGSVLIPFVNFTVITTAGTFISTPFTNVVGSYTLGPADGQAYITLFNFPGTGNTPVFAVSFKKHCQRVVGFSAVTSTNATSNLWTLFQAERYN